MYALGTQQPTIIYHWEMDRDDANGKWTSRYRTLAGTLAVQDEVLWSGGQLRRYSYQRYTINEQSSVEVQGGKLIFTRVMDGKKDQAEEDYKPNFTVGPTVIPYVQKNWSALVGGKSLPIRYGVLDRMETIGFDLKRDTGHQRSGPNSVVIRMRASSLFVRLAVDPIYFVLSNDGNTLYEIIGRSLPVERPNGKLRPVDGDLVVQPIAIQKRSQP
jgi:hypothetical protein